MAGSSLRAWILRLHMLFGLLLSAYAVVIGLTGSALVFRGQIAAWENPQFSTAAPLAVATTPDQALASVRKEWPTAVPLTVTWPNHDSPFWMTYILLKEGGAREVFTHPATGEVAGSRDPSGGWSGWLGRFHTNLLLSGTGRRWNGNGAWLLIGMSISGIFLWLPRDGAKISRNFRLSPAKGWRIFSRQVHLITGAIALPYILVLAVTGSYFMHTGAYVKAIGSVFRRTAEPEVTIAPGGILPLTELSSRARAALPGREIQRLQVVQQPSQPVRVTMREGSPDEFHLVSTVFLHPVTGEVLRVDRLETRPAGDSILAWFSALHFGNFGGDAVRVLWALLGLSLPALSVTGCRMWWRRVVEPRFSEPGLKERRVGGADRSRTDE